MPKDMLTEDEAQELSEGFSRQRETRELWQRQGRRFMDSYGGEWIALHVGEVVAHSRNPGVLEGKIARLKVPRKELLIRFVPKAGIRYVV